MLLEPYEPLRQLANIHKDFERFFTDFPSPFNQHSGHIRVDVHEAGTEVIATCDLPGLERKEDLHLDIQNNDVLLISGTINRTNETKDEHLHRQERFIGRFHRYISLPHPVKYEGVKASYKNGVLEVRMPKMKQDNKKQIEINFTH